LTVLTSILAALMDLFVEDGWIAAGTVGALAALALLEIGPTAGSPAAELGGGVLPSADALAAGESLRGGS
jgi:hypothetical protein